MILPQQAPVPTDTSDKQPLDATLTALAGVATAADKLIYATGSDTFATADLTAFGRSLIDDASAAAARSTLGGLREVLTAARTYYVRTDGSDSNNGLTNTAGGAFLTLQKAVDVAAGLDNGGFNVTIQVGAGTFTARTLFKSSVGAGMIILTGDPATPSNVVVSTTSTNCFGNTTPWIGVYELTGFKLQTSGSTAHAIQIVGNSATLRIGNVEFGAVSGSHVYMAGGSTIQVTANYSVSGNASRHGEIFSASQFLFDPGRTVTLQGNLSITTYLRCSSTGIFDAENYLHRYKLPISGTVGTFAVGETITGGTSAATGVVAVVGASELLLSSRSGVFAAAETITGGTSGATATVSSAMGVTGTRYNVDLNAVVKTNGAGASYLPGSTAGTTATGGQYN